LKRNCDTVSRGGENILLEKANDELPKEKGENPGWFSLDTSSACLICNKLTLTIISGRLGNEYESFLLLVLADLCKAICPQSGMN
jgi:hypothetical protein